ncbi:synaptotagmin-like protein 2 isoform X2 [Sparus aurata]|uniref:synaptotagmin-like protein 2 isoform X2 n=1 Tax=Sparus aurata TaxID=8175 RepID=UPI0011C1368B|nr:synaptotagmin-like protein 2 isoform X2 [Sparus aurata]
MIDLSHLTEEEQEAIMTVLRRDAELKKAEEERIRKLEDILNSGSQLDTKRKYLTGEWFYEAKSRRHMDKIHGSEIILASMKQKKAALDGSLRIERSKTPSSRGSDAPPPKPARCLEALQPQEINDAEKENLNSEARSPRPPRHNPFNRASLIVVEPPENNDVSASRTQESSETEPIPPLKSHPAGEASQTSGGSITSEGSSVGFRPVPKKRTFLSRRTSTQSQNNGPGSDAQVGSAGVVPAPRRSLQRGSSGSSNQSHTKGQDETPQKCVASDQVSQLVQPSKSLCENSQQPLCDVSQVSSNSSLERERNPPSLIRDRPAYTRNETSTDREVKQKSDEWDGETQRERAAANAVDLHSGSIQDSDRENSSSVGTSMRQEEPSLPQSTVDADPPVSYDLIFIDKSDKQMQKKSNQNQVFKLSTQTTSPTSDEDSIAKVLDWFSRSTDSSEWLNTEDGPEVATGSNKHVEISKLRGEDSFRKDAGDVVSDRQKESLEMKRSHSQKQSSDAKESSRTDRTGNKEVAETQEEVAKRNRERMRSQEFEDNNDESQPPQISHLKSFWEKSNMGPKILISNSIMPSNKGQKPAQLSAEKDEEKVNKPHGVSDMPSVPGLYNGKGSYGDERGQQLVISPQKDTGDSVHLNRNQEGFMTDTPTQRNSKLAVSAHVVDRRGSENDILGISRLSPLQRNAVQSRLSPESESVKPNPQADSISQYRETPLQDELPKTTSTTTTQRDTDLQTRDSPDSEMLYLSRNSPYLDYKQGDIQITPKTQVRRGSNEDARRRDSEDRSMQPGMSPKRKEDMSTKDRINSPQSNRRGVTNQESTAERIKQLRSFWEQERNKPMFYTGKPRTLGDGKVARGANQAKLNKRFTKSEYDLTSIGNNSGSDEEDYDRNFNVLPLNQRIEKSSPSLGASRAQFNTLREFWDEATSDTKGSFTIDKPKSPKRKEPISAQLSSQELKCGDPEIYREKTRQAAKSSPQNRSKSPHDRQSGSRAANDSKNNQSNYTTAEQQRESRRSSKDSTKPQSSSGKETRAPKGKKDSFSYSSSRGHSLRRATSMFALSEPEERDLSPFKVDVSPVHSQSRKQRQNTEKGTTSRRSTEETEPLTPRARSCVPRDYRHYLGMTDATSVHTSLAPALKDEESDGKSGYEFDLGGPVRASTPVSSEDRYGRKGNKTNQRPLWTNYSSSDTGLESSVSSTSETWSTSRTSSNRENTDEAQNPVRKALRRAEARPKNLAKSMEDITASLSPRQERRQDPTADMRRISAVSTIPSPSSSLFSDPDHLKKMSKSVPSFLQKELSGSVMTMYSDFGNVEVQGNIQFSINYIQRLREFHIFVAECRDLATADPKRGRSDPYVKSYLVPDKANLGKRKTSVKKKTLNPTFNEILRYRVRMEYLRTQTLILSVWHHDTFGKNSFLGEVDVDLSKWDFDHTQMNYLALKARTTPTLAPSNDRGEMRVAVRFMPQIIHSEGLAKEGPNTGEIHIWVKDCKNLPLIRATIDPYVKCFVLPDTSRKSRQKTRVLRRTADPAFNHTMVYDGIREADLSDACVELTVWDRDRLASNLLGGLRLGPGTGRSYGSVVDWMDSTPYEAALWERMRTTPNEWVEDVLPLRVLNSAKLLSNK